MIHFSCKQKIKETTNDFPFFLFSFFFFFFNFFYFSDETSALPTSFKNDATCLRVDNVFFITKNEYHECLRGIDGRK